MNRDDDKAYLLKHGTTIHGAQLKDPAAWRETIGYYTSQGPVGQVFSALNPTGRLNDVALVGLGVGGIVCYSRPGQRWSIYEIDPVVERIARDTRYFHYLSECFDPSRMDIKIGDARLTLANEPHQKFDLLILDAFSSDSVPVHLLTREALSLYRDRLTEGGLILLHISNRFLDLRSVVGRLIADAGMHGVIQWYQPAHKDINDKSSIWVVLARDEADLGPLRGDPRWKAVEARDASSVWTDDFSNILSVFRIKITFGDTSDSARD
jgi:hypothetical protein